MMTNDHTERKTVAELPKKRHSPSWSFVVRAIQVLPEFNRTQLAILSGEPYGTISRIISMLENGGWIRPNDAHASYSEAELKRNPELKGFKLNYGVGNNTKTSACYERTETWSQFMTIWRGNHEMVEQRLRKNGDDGVAEDV